MYWNINGVGDKFDNEYVIELLSNSNADILIITETHFKIRFKTPQKYFFVAKSNTEYKNKARGGVAIYQRLNCNLNLDVISNDFNDLIVFTIRNSDFIFAAVYLPPIDSSYFSKDYFQTLDLKSVSKF